MPHMSPMHWAMMFIGTWSLLNLLFQNTHYLMAKNLKNFYNFHGHHTTAWNW